MFYVQVVDISPTTFILKNEEPSTAATTQDMPRATHEGSSEKNIAQLEEEVKTYQNRLSTADKNRVEILENKNVRLEKELADLEKAYESVQNYARAEGILIGHIEQGRTMAKEMRRKQEAFDRKAKGYENAIAKKKEHITNFKRAHLSTLLFLLFFLNYGNLYKNMLK